MGHEKPQYCSSRIVFDFEGSLDSAPDHTMLLPTGDNSRPWKSVIGTRPCLEQGRHEVKRAHLLEVVHVWIGSVPE